MATLDQSFTTNDDANNLGIVGTRIYVAQQIVIGVAGVVSRLEWNLKTSTTPIGNATCWVYSDSSDSPGSAISDGVTLDVTTVTGSLVYYAFNFTTKPVVGVGTKIWSVLKYTTGDGDYIMYGNNSSGGYTGVNGKESILGTIWTTLSQGDLNFKEYYDPIPVTGAPTLSMMGV